MPCFRTHSKLHVTVNDFFFLRLTEPDFQPAFPPMIMPSLLTYLSFPIIYIVSYIMLEARNVFGIGAAIRLELNKTSLWSLITCRDSEIVGKVIV